MLNALQLLLTENLIVHNACMLTLFAGNLVRHDLIRQHEMSLIFTTSDKCCQRCLEAAIRKTINNLLAAYESDVMQHHTIVSQIVVS